MNRRRILTASLVSLISFGFGFFGGTNLTSGHTVVTTIRQDITKTVTETQQQTRQKITFAYTGSKRFNHYHLEVATKALRKKGYDMDFLFVDASRGREMFATKKTNVSSVSPVATLALAETGEKVIFGPALNLVNVVMVSKKELHEILAKDKMSVGIALLGSPDHYAASQFFEAHNLEKISLVEIGLSRNRLAALESGNIDIAAINIVDAVPAIQQGLDLKLISEPYTFWLPASHHEDWVLNNKKLIHDFTESLILAKNYCAGDMNRLISEALQYGELEESPENIELARKVFELYEKEKFWTFVTPPDEFYRDFYDWAVEQKLLTGKVDIELLTQPYKQIVDELFTGHYG